LDKAIGCGNRSQLCIPTPFLISCPLPDLYKFGDYWKYGLPISLGWLVAVACAVVFEVLAAAFARRFLITMVRCTTRTPTRKESRDG
jgi:hypothetical protein